MKLSTNFTFEELTDSEGHPKLVPQNRIEAQKYTGNLTNLAVHILQPLRDALNKRIDVTSGFRGPSLNKAVGGSSTGAHPKGMAADIQIDGMPVDTAFLFIMGHKDIFNGWLDKCIIEKIGSRKWIHISVAADPKSARNEFYSTVDGKNYTRVA